MMPFPKQGFPSDDTDSLAFLTSSEASLERLCLSSALGISLLAALGSLVSSSNLCALG